MAEFQTIPARYGVATFVPAGQSIKIVNTSGTQVINTWAFALPKPDFNDPPGEGEQAQQEWEDQSEQKESGRTTTASKKKRLSELPGQEESERLVREAQTHSDEDGPQSKNGAWSSYVSSLGFGGTKGNQKQEHDQEGKEENEKQKNPRTWGSYFTAGKAFSSYIPEQATDTVSQFARDVSALSGKEDGDGDGDR